MNTEPIHPSTLAILDRHVEAHGNTVRITTQLDRKDYLFVNAVLASIGGTWNKKLKVHTFPSDIEDAFDQLLLTGAMPKTLKNDNVYDYFRTPDAIADRVVALADIHPHHLLLDPSAGDCALLKAYYRTLPHIGDHLAGVTAFDIDARWRPIMDEQSDFAYTVDYLSYPQGDCHVDRIIMNPPFSKMQDVKHVLHAYSMLAPGGRLVAIMSNAVTFRTNALYVALRAVIAEHGSLETLPAGAFRESGTMVNTVIVILDKTDDAQ